jgi:acyl-CoA synthetase (NDP forming)
MITKDFATYAIRILRQEKILRDHVPVRPDNSMNRGVTDPLAVMLEAGSVALVGASPRPGSLGARMIEEVAKSASAPRQYLVNPRYNEIGRVRCHPTLDDLPEAVDLALLAVPDAALEQQLKAAAKVGVRSAVIFGSAVEQFGQAAPGSGPQAGIATATGAAAAASAAGTTLDAHSRVGLRDRIAATARDAGMPVCGAGCMGFVNVARGLRAIGYTEPDPLPAGPVALVTHSGSVFSALLRTRRAFGFTVAVSSGQELVTPAAAYAGYALTLPETKVLALVLEAIRDGALLRSVLADAAARDVPVVLLAAGTSAASRSLVAAHSGALAAGDGAWQALASAHGVHRVGDLAELADTLELFCAGRRAWGAGSRTAGSGRAPALGGAGQGRGGVATVHDSGFERAHVADVAASVGVPFAQLTEETRQRLAAVLDLGLEPGNPLDVWGTGRDSEGLFTETLSALADDANVGAVALAVDLVPEYDGDDSYRDAVLTAAATTGKPVVVLASVPAAIDADAATRLRAAGVPVLESTRSGLLALGHLLAHARNGDPDPPSPAAGALPATRTSATARRSRWVAALAAGPPSGADLFDLLRDYGVPAVRARSAGTLAAANEAAAAIGYPVAIKTDEPEIAHKSDVGGVHLNVADSAGVAAAYEDLAARLGPRVTVCEMAAQGTELILGLARDPALGPLIVVGAGGVLAEYLSERSVALPPLTSAAAARLISGLRVADIMAGVRGQPPCDVDAIADVLASFSRLAADLGDYLDAFDINPLICSPSGALAVDALALPRHR